MPGGACYDVAMQTAVKRPVRRRLRLLLAATTVLIVVLAGSWQSYWVRHKILRLVTGVEAALYFIVPAPRSETAGSETVYLHRGQLQDGPANSAAALQQANGRVRGVELDVCFTADMVPYLSHGDDFAGARPQSLDFQALGSREAGSMLRSDGEPFLSLHDFVREHAGNFPCVLLDVKTDHSDAAAKAAALVECLAEDVGRYRVTCLSGRLLWEVKALRPDLPCGCETMGPIAAWLGGFDAFHARLSEVEDSTDAAARGLGLQRLYFVVGSADELRRVEELKPEAFIAGPEFCR